MSKNAQGPEKASEIGERMYNLAARLFPICRSITGNGVRETLKIIGEHIPLTVHEVPTGTPAFDWNVPREWNIRDAYIADSKGKRIVDFRKNNLHVVGYSMPVDTRISLAGLQKHIYSIPEQPDAIPYVTSYYEPRWGFCMTDRQRKKLPNDTYHVYIDSELKDGSLTYGECIIPGKSTKEIFLSTYVCHPSMGNNETSGPVVTTHLVKRIMEQPRQYTYRIVFIPETIGSLVYLSTHLEEMKKNIIAGFNITCVGDDRAYSYLPSREGGTLADKVAQNVLSFEHPEYKTYSYLDRGSDERQYCSPGVDLPVVSIMRSKYCEYPEYHTSLDNLELITPEGLAGAYNVLEECISAIEINRLLRATCYGEPQLGKRGFYPSTSTKATRNTVRDILNILAYADGTRDLIDVSNTIRVPVKIMLATVEALEANGLLVPVDTV